MQTTDSDLSQYLQTNTRWAIMKWEPMAGSGEILNVGALLQRDGTVEAHVLVKSEVLHCMYGGAALRAMQMIQYALEAARGIAADQSLEAAIIAPALENCRFGAVMDTYADDRADAIRQIVSECCSLGTLPTEPEEEADTAPLDEREVQRQWTTRIRNVIQVERPDLVRFFGGQATIVEGGQAVKFGFLAPSLVAHFGLLKPNQQGQGMKDARSKMWELSLARERNPSLATALILGTPHENDILLSERTLAQISSNVAELTQEAAQSRLSLRPVHTEREAADALIGLI
ncbi:hypothetical protein [Paraburkholderia sp. JHI869]|uniref:hypothetical protein n=1 Tax=Paraburkholderia sp. JHI869 TaxID=3112959 RepID=UPI003180B403